MCGHFLETLCQLLSQPLNPHYEKFAKVLRGLDTKFLQNSGLLTHASQPGLKKCKLAAFEFIYTLSVINPKLDIDRLLGDANILESYSNWKSKQAIMNSNTCGGYQLEKLEHLLLARTSASPCGSREATEQNSQQGFSLDLNSCSSAKEESGAHTAEPQLPQATSEANHKHLDSDGFGCL